MTQALTDSPLLDLSRCDKEAMRTPGSIQPHGFLLSLDHDHAILQASDNLAALAGVDAAQALGQPLAQVVGAAAGTAILGELQVATITQRPSYWCTLAIGAQHDFDVLVHRYDSPQRLRFLRITSKSC